MGTLRLVEWGGDPGRRSNMFAAFGCNALPLCARMGQGLQSVDWDVGVKSEWCPTSWAWLSAIGVRDGERRDGMGCDVLCSRCVMCDDKPPLKNGMSPA
jgi:hypothetical protein